MKFTDEKIENYSLQMSNKPSENCDLIESYTRENVDMHQMLIGKLEASIFGLLIRLVNAKNVLEIGTFTGYSALAMAEQLPNDGKVITLDINEINGKLAKSFWDKSPHGSKITQILGPALDSIDNLNEKFDLVFIDADKENYLNYLNKTLPMLSENGIIVLDNVLWGGRVIDENDNNSSTLGIREVNEYVANSDDLYATLLPIRDGIFVIKKQ